MSISPEELRRAFEKADAILALEGFDRTPDTARLQEAVIAGRMTVDEAVQYVIEEAKRRAHNNAAA